MTPTHAAIFAAVCALLATLVSAWVSSRSAHEANEIAEYKAVIEGMQATIAGMKVLQDAQGGRISALEAELTTVKAALVTEQQGHRETREQFSVATRYIRELLAWIKGGLSTGQHHPPPPESLADWL